MATSSGPIFSSLAMAGWKGGGGVPADPFIVAFQVPTVGVSLANFDDNQHTDDENLMVLGLELMDALKMVTLDGRNAPAPVAAVRPVAPAPSEKPSSS